VNEATNRLAHIWDGFCSRDPYHEDENICSIVVLASAEYGLDLEKHERDGSNTFWVIDRSGYFELAFSWAEESGYQVTERHYIINPEEDKK
jgi:hypothetical protein